MVEFSGQRLKLQFFNQRQFFNFFASFIVNDQFNECVIFFVFVQFNQFIAFTANRIFSAERPKKPPGQIPYPVNGGMVLSFVLYGLEPLNLLPPFVPPHINSYIKRELTESL
jgi:hypothetical protein